MTMAVTMERERQREKEIVLFCRNGTGQIHGYYGSLRELHHF